MNLPVLQHQGPTMTNGRLAKFVYPSGARPLSGFTVKRGIGRGGFGEVYYAISDAGKDVALKLIQRSHDVELRGVRQCLNFRHPHLVEIYDIRESDSGDWWIVMEYVAGESLQATLEKSPQGFDSAEALAWIRGATAGVAGLHERGVVHRDLKPGNIFRADGVVKIGDYGLSKFISASRRSAQTESIGTIHYMAPEVAGGRYGKEIDVYALGVILYEMLAGKLPFEGESLAEILMKHLSATPDLSPLPANVRSVVGRCLAKDPKQRYPGATELAAALEAALAGRPSEAPRVPPAFLGGVAPLPAHGSTPDARRPFDSTIGHAKPAEPVVAAAPRTFAAHPDVAAAVGSVAPAFATAASPAPAPAASPTPALQFPPAAAAPNAPASDAADFVEDPWPETPREPLWAAMGANWERLDDAPLVKAGLIAGIVLSLAMAPWIWVLLAWVYIVYYAAWSAIAWVVYAGEVASRSAAEALEPRRSKADRRPLGVVRPESAPVPPTRTPRWRNGFDARSGRSQLTLPKKSFFRWVGELSRSCVTAAAIAASVAAAWSALVWKQTGNWPEIERFAALAIVGAAASWTVMSVSKFWEGSNEDPFYRRIMLGASGLVVGAFAYAIELGLMIGAPVDAAPTTMTSVMRGEWEFFGGPGVPSLLGSMAFFGFFFAVIKWWNQADPLRASRFSLWRVAGAAFWGLLLSQVWPFPDSFGTVWAVMIALAVQASTPWQLVPAMEARDRAERGEPAAAA